ncbi:PAS domain S-box protein [Haloferax namakaokahaiae]|uniref:PAS domain S-box protein n=1 Tax=Haloferax namakaokahaiae TaxID=1748331 RepID=A0ABD5ZE60_9EURY
MASASLTDAQRETLELFDGFGEPLTTSDVAERLDLGRRSAYGRLERLVDCGVLETKKVGANARVWWRRPDAPSPDREADGEVNPRPGDEDTLFGLLVDAVEEYAIFLLDEDGNVRTWNPGARKIKGYEADEIVGEHFSTFYTDDDQAADVPEQNLAEAVEHGNTEDEGWRVRKDGSRFWANVTITTVRDETGDIQGFAKVTRDMTERREREQQLRRERDLVDQIFETSPVGLGVLTRDGLERTNPRAAEIYGSPTGDIDEYTVGEPAVYGPDQTPVPPAERPNARVFETGEPVHGWECQLHSIDGQHRWLSVSAAPLTYDTGDVERVVVATKDITHLKEQSRRLERQRDDLEAELDEVLERVDDAFCALDEEFRFTYANQRAAELLQVHTGELLGECIWDLYPDATETPVWNGLREAMETQATTEFEVYGEELEAWLQASVYPSETGLSVYFRDITDRKLRVRELERYETIFETVDDGIYVVDTDGYLTMANEGYAELTGYPHEQLVGMHVSELVDEETVEKARTHEQELVANERETARFEADVLTADGGTVRAEGAFSIIESPNEGYERIGVVRDISERVARERKLERQRERLAALDDLNRVVRALSEAAIDQSTRVEIEQTVCEGLAATDSIQFAWVGEVDGETMTVCSRAEAGVGGFLDEGTVAFDLDESGRSDLIGRAVKTREMQVVEDALNHDEDEHLREQAIEWGFRSTATIPITHEGAFYGVLNVYTDRPDAFVGAEGDAIGHLSEIVGHAISAIEQKRALRSDEVVELVFHISDFFGAFDFPSADGRVTFDRAIPVGDGVYLEYGTATPEMSEVLEALVEDLPHWESIQFLDGDSGEDASRFELRLVEPPLLSSLTAIGGYVDRAAIEEGCFQIRLHVSPSADIRQVIEVVEEAYPMADMISRRQVTKTSPMSDGRSRLLVEDLTDRQRTVLETAFFSGYFESPRPIPGKHLADTLGIAGPTFHQHLRKAQKKVLAHVLDS